MVVGGMCGCRGCAWLQGGVHGCRGTCMVAGGHAWLWGGMHGCGEGRMVEGHAWLQGGVHGIRRDTVNERAVRILLECILILSEFAIDINDGYTTGVFTGKIDVIEPAPEPNSL